MAVVKVESLLSRQLKRSLAIPAANKYDRVCPTTYYPLLTTNFGVRSDPELVTDRTQLGS